MAIRRGVLSSLLQSSAGWPSTPPPITDFFRHLPRPAPEIPITARWRYFSSDPPALHVLFRSLHSSSSTCRSTLSDKLLLELRGFSSIGSTSTHGDPVDANSQEPLSKRRPGAKLSSVDKRKFLINTLMDLKESKEAVYGTLDAWVAWERNFPLVSLKRALLILQKEEQWHRVVQVIKWMLSKGQATTMGTYEQLIRALEKDNRAEEAHRMWVKKISHDLHSVPWQFCELMISIYYRNNMLERLVKLFKALESYERRPPRKSIVQKVADAYELLGLLEEKNKILEKYSDLFSDSSKEHSKRSRKGSRRNDKKAGKETTISNMVNENVEAESSPSDEDFVVSIV